MLSKRCLYAIQAATSLAQHFGQQIVTKDQIANERGIPPRFLETVLLDLKQAGIAKSTRGKEGGYALNRRPDQTRIGEIVRVFEKNDRHQPTASKKTSLWTQKLEHEALDAYLLVFDRLTLADALEKERFEKSAKAHSYVI